MNNTQYEPPLWKIPSSAQIPSGKEIPLFTEFSLIQLLLNYKILFLVIFPYIQKLIDAFLLPGYFKVLFFKTL